MLFELIGQIIYTKKKKFILHQQQQYHHLLPVLNHHQLAAEMNKCLIKNLFKNFYFT